MASTTHHFSIIWNNDYRIYHWNYYIFKIIDTSFSKMYHTIYLIIIGLSLGSILSMFINPDTMLIYQSWHHSGINVLDLTLAIVLFVLGIITSYYLVLKQRKHDQSEQKA